MGKIVRDRTRTALSLLGVSIGIFTVTTVQMAVGALRQGIEDSLDSFGRDVLIVDRMPMEPETDEDGNVRWWEYATRPDITLAEYRHLQKSCEGRAEFAYVANLGDGAMVGYKYFDCQGSVLSSVTTRGWCYGGVLELLKSPESKEVLGQIPIGKSNECKNWPCYVTIPDGVHALYFRYKGYGYIDLFDFALDAEK